MALPKWLQILEQFGPLLLMINPVTAPIAPFVVTGIKLAEQIPGATGAQKKDFVTQLVSLGAQATNTAVGHTEMDPAAYSDAVSSGIDTTVKVVNIIHSMVAEDAAENPPVAPPPPTA